MYVSKIILDVIFLISLLLIICFRLYLDGDGVYKFTRKYSKQASPIIQTFMGERAIRYADWSE